MEIDEELEDVKEAILEYAKREQIGLIKGSEIDLIKGKHCFENPSISSIY